MLTELCVLPWRETTHVGEPSAMQMDVRSLHIYFQHTFFSPSFIIMVVL